MDTLKQYTFLIIFLGLLALTLFAPIASNDYLPNSPDFANHVVSISQAKQALEQGQFPVRVAPELYQQWQYPHYQFYSPLAYLIAGSIHKWIAPDNPFIAYKITLWFALLLAGIYIFRLANLFVKSRGAALLSATLYLLSPILILNISIRGDFTEALATCILPIALYYSIQCHQKPNLINFAATALAWFALATTHLITFVFSSMFVSAFLICLNIRNAISLRNLIYVGVAYSWSWLLAAWFLIPIILLHSELYTDHVLQNPYYKNWLSPLATLLAPAAVSPMPLPGNGKLFFPFYVGIGWPMLLGIGIVIYKRCFESIKKIPTFVTPLLCLFLIALFVAWSPVNFWNYLPEPFAILQFGFRILIQNMWIGVLLCAWALVEFSQNKLDVRHVALGIFLIGIANSSWFLTNQMSSKKITELVQHPALYEWGARAYVVSPLLFPHTNPEKFLTVTQTQRLCHTEKRSLMCQIKLSRNELVQLPLLYYPNMLDIKVDGQSVDYQAIVFDKKITDSRVINPMLTGVELQRGTHVITAQFSGLKWANWISLIAWIVMLCALIGTLAKKRRVD